MIDISFVQDNLPTPEEQLKLFKEILESESVKVISLSLTDIRNLPKELKDKILQLGIQQDITFELPFFKKDTYLLNRTIIRMIEELTRAILKENAKSVYILKPEALLNQKYIYCYSLDNSVILEGLLGIYFDNN